MLKCCACKQYKDENEFHKSTVLKRGYDYRCKNCNSKRNKLSWPIRKAKSDLKRKEKYDKLSDFEKLTLKQKRSLEHTIWYWDNIKYIMYHRAKERATKTGVPFAITIDDIIIPDKCPLLN